MSDWLRQLLCIHNEKHSWGDDEWREAGDGIHERRYWFMHCVKCGNQRYVPTNKYRPIDGERFQEFFI